MTWDFFCEVPELRIEFFRKMFFGISFSFFFFFGCEFQVLRLFVLERAEDFVCYSVVVVVFRFEFGFSPNGHQKLAVTWRKKKKKAKVTCLMIEGETLSFQLLIIIRHSVWVGLILAKYNPGRVISFMKLYLTPSHSYIIAHFYFILFIFIFCCCWFVAILQEIYWVLLP